MPIYAGLDLARYPGTQAMQWLWSNTNLYWVGFYLPVAGPGLSDKKSWIGKYRTLRNMGWGMAPIYVGKQASPLRMKPGTEAAEGLKDGFEAAQFARSEGMPPGTVIYFDLEGGDDLRERWKKYYFAWAEAVLTRLYYPGLYISHRIVSSSFLSEVSQSVGVFAPYMGRPEVWGVNITSHPVRNKDFRNPRTGAIVTNYEELEPRGSAAAEATSWQYAFECRIYWKDESRKKPVTMPIWPVDLNTSSYRDPGQAGYSLDIL